MSDMVYGPDEVNRREWDKFKRTIEDNLDHFTYHQVFVAIQEVKLWRLPSDLQREKIELIQKMHKAISWEERA